MTEETMKLRYGVCAVLTLDPDNPRKLKETPTIKVSPAHKVSQSQGAPMGELKAPR